MLKGRSISIALLGIVLLLAPAAAGSSHQIARARASSGGGAALLAYLAAIHKARAPLVAADAAASAVLQKLNTSTPDATWVTAKTALTTVEKAASQLASAVKSLTPPPGLEAANQEFLQSVQLETGLAKQLAAALSTNDVATVKAAGAKIPTVTAEINALEGKWRTAVTAAAHKAGVAVPTWVATLVSGAQGTAPSAPAPAAASAATPTTSLKSKLLRLSQLPTGWVATRSSNLGISGCSANLLGVSGMKRIGVAQVAYSFGGLKSFPQLIEAMGSFTSATNATKAFANIVSLLKACKHFSGNANGQSVSGTVGRLSFGRYGNQSAAYKVSFNATGLSVTEDLVLLRKGAIVLELAEANRNRGVDASQFHGFVTQAVKRLG